MKFYLGLFTYMRTSRLSPMRLTNLSLQESRVDLTPLLQRFYQHTISVRPQRTGTGFKAASRPELASIHSA